MKDSARKAMFYRYGKLSSTNDPKTIKLLNENNRLTQGYYDTHFTPFENSLIAKGSSAGEVYGHVFGNHNVTTRQKMMAKKALINQSKTNGNDKENALKYLKEMRKL